MIKATHSAPSVSTLDYFSWLNPQWPVLRETFMRSGGGEGRGGKNISPRADNHRFSLFKLFWSYLNGWGKMRGRGAFNNIEEERVAVFWRQQRRRMWASSLTSPREAFTENKELVIQRKCLLNGKSQQIVETCSSDRNLICRRWGEVRSLLLFHPRRGSSTFLFHLRPPFPPLRW